MLKEAVICIVDDEGTLHKMRNPDAFGDKEILQEARSLANQYTACKAIMKSYEERIDNLKKRAKEIGLELEP